MKTIKIFAYGTLINEDSLKKTIKNYKILFPAKLYGFIRVFNVKETRKLTMDFECSKRASLNIEKSEWNQYINGVCFEMDIKELEALKQREHQYELIQVEISEFDNDKNTHKAYVWRALHFEATDFNYESKAQMQYLQTCIIGSQKYGLEFERCFLETTHIGEELVADLIEQELLLFEKFKK